MSGTRRVKGKRRTLGPWLGVRVNLIGTRLSSITWPHWNPSKRNEWRPDR